MSQPAPRIPRQRAPRRAESLLTTLLPEIAGASQRHVVLTLDEALDRVPADAALEVSEAVWLLLEHLDHHPGDEPVVVAVELAGDELCARVADDRCSAPCATRSPEVGRVWSLATARPERRCDVVSGALGGVRMTWSARVADAGSRSGVLSGPVPG